MTIQDIIYTFTASLIALFPVMNPIGSGFIINGTLQNLDESSQKAAIKKILSNILLIAFVSLLAGHFILLIFGLAIPIIEVGGGIIICQTGLGWLSESEQEKQDSKQKEADKIDIEKIENKLFYPLSFPIALGPGSISVIFTLMATSVKGNLLRTGLNYVAIALAIISMCTILYFILSQGKRINKRLGHSGSLIINKMVAFITFCIGIQIIVTGISKIFHLNVL